MMMNQGDTASKNLKKLVCPLEEISLLAEQGDLLDIYLEDVIHITGQQLHCIHFLL